MIVEQVCVCMCVCVSLNCGPFLDLFSFFPGKSESYRLTPDDRKVKDSLVGNIYSVKQQNYNKQFDLPIVL